MNDKHAKQIKQITQSIAKYTDEYQTIIQLVMLGIGILFYNLNLWSNILVLVVFQLLSLSISLKQRQLSEEKFMDILGKNKTQYVSEPINLNEFIGSAKKEVYCYSVFGAWLPDRRHEIIELCKSNVRVHIMIGASSENYTEYAKLFSTDEVIYNGKIGIYKANLSKFESEIKLIQHYINNDNLEVRCVNKVFPCSFFVKDPDQQNGTIFWREYLPPTKQNKANSYHGYFIHQSDVCYSSYIGYIRELWDDLSEYQLND